MRRFALGIRWLAASFALPAVALALDYAEISAQPQLWPREVTVRVPVNVPIVSGGQSAGTMQLPAGRTLRLVKVEATALTLEMNGARLTVRPSETDLMQRVLARSGAPASASPATPAPTSAPAAADTPVPPAPVAAASAPPAATKPAAPTAPAAAGAWPTQPGLHRAVQMTAITLPKPVPGLEASFTATESFDLYLPKNFDPTKPSGLLIFIPSSDKHLLPEQYTALFDEFGIVAIAPHRAGNNESFARRGGLAVALARQAQAAWKIDPARVIMSGNSGGGRVATRIGHMCGDVFSGVIALSSADVHKDMPLAKDPGRVQTGFATSASNPKPVPLHGGQLALARSKVRFALLGGAEDKVSTNLAEVADFYRREGFKVTLVQQPGLDHRPVDAPFFRRGLVFVLTGKVES